MIKFLVFIAAACILYKLVVGDRKKKHELRQQAQRSMEKEGILVKDPVCGTYVSKESDIRVKHGDRTLYFCSYDCRDKYLKKIEHDTDAA